MEVGIRELKQHLSEWLNRTAMGEVITVTDRGVPKALLTPLPGVGHYQRGIEEGWLRAPRTNGLTPVTRSASPRTTQRVLEEDRDE